VRREAETRFNKAGSARRKDPPTLLVVVGHKKERKGGCSNNAEDTVIIKQKGRETNAKTSEWGGIQLTTRSCAGSRGPNSEGIAEKQNGDGRSKSVLLVQIAQG